MFGKMEEASESSNKKLRGRKEGEARTLEKDLLIYNKSVFYFVEWKRWPVRKSSLKQSCTFVTLLPRE